MELRPKFNIWPDFENALEKIKETRYNDIDNSELRFFMEISADRKGIYENVVKYGEEHQNSRVEYVKELSEDELQRIYKASRDWLELLNERSEVSYQVESEDYFKKQKYLIVKTYITNEYRDASEGDNHCV